MSEIRSLYICEYGIPVTGLSPAFTSLLKLSDASSIVFPTITEVGAGFYKFVVDVPFGETWVGVVDAGATVDDQARYIPVSMGHADTDQNIDVMVNPVYNEDVDSLLFMVYMMVKGVVCDDVDSVSLTVYDTAHVELFTVSGSSSTNGVFVLSKTTPGLSVGVGYYAVAEITVGSATYQSVESMFTLN